MATIQIRKCEKCGKEARQDIEKDLYEGYRSISLHIEHWPSNLKVLKQFIHLCPDCLAKIGIAYSKIESVQEKESLADRLYDIVAEIIQAELQQ